MNQLAYLKNNVDNSYKLTSGHPLPLENWNYKESLKKDTIYSKPCINHKTENILYCFNCQIGICTYCRNDHADHIYTIKNNFTIKPQLESLLFDKIDQSVRSTFELSYPKKLYDFFHDKLDKHFKTLQENLEKYRVQRLKELHTIFEMLEVSAKLFNSNYKDCKGSFKNFINDTKNFFPNNYFSEVVFVQLFNFINNGTLNEKIVLNEIKSIKQKTISYEEDLSKSLFDIEILFKESMSKNSSQESLQWIKNENPFSSFVKEIEENSSFIEKFNSSIIKKKKMKQTGVSFFDASITSISSIAKVGKNSSVDKKIQQDNLNIPIIINDRLNIPNSRNNLKLLSKNNSLPENANANKTITYNNRTANQDNSNTKAKKKEEIVLDVITNMKIYENTYINFIQTGEFKINKVNLKESNQINKILEANEIKSFNMSNRSKLPKNMNVYLSPQIKISNTYSVSNQLLNLLKVYADLNNNKNKLLRNEIKSPIHSDANNLLTGSSLLTFLEEEGFDYFQAIPGSKKLQIYDFQNKKPYVVETYSLNSTDHGYNYFPYGSRSYYSNDKIYIIGGRDIDKEYKTILVYEINTTKLTRIEDMNFSRSYHSILLNNDRKLLYLIGGENNNTCEALSLLDQTIIPMPNMTVPRANATLYIYKNTYLYAFCGYKTSIISKELNPTFERLNLNYSITKSGEYGNTLEFDINWEKIQISNKAEIELKFEYIAITPLTDSHIFLYAGYDLRQVHRSIIIFDFLNHMIFNTKDKEFAELKLSLIYDKSFNDAFEILFG